LFKNAARRHVVEKSPVGDNPITTAEDLVAFGNKYLAEGRSTREGMRIVGRKFYVREDVPNGREGMLVTGSRSTYHCFRSAANAKGFGVRMVSCACDACWACNYDACATPGAGAFTAKEAHYI
jgi:hypothetical protein